MTDSGAAATKIPLGIPDLDRRLRGGVSPGTSVLAIGPVGTGYNEFVDTAAVMHGNWLDDSGLFDLEYDAHLSAMHRPSAVNYLSLTQTVDRVRADIRRLVEDDWEEPAFNQIRFDSLADSVADLGPVRVDGSGSFAYGQPAGEQSEAYQAFMRQFGNDISAAIDDSVVVIDALSNVIPIIHKYLDWSDTYFVVQTLCHMVATSDSLLLASADADVCSDRERALLKELFDVVLEFGWFGDGIEQRRTLRITKFPEYQQHNPDEGRVVFDVKIDRGYFGVSSVEKIPPSRL
jgi:archaellum biogenesis ATPase FlaH